MTSNRYTVAAALMLALTFNAVAAPVKPKPKPAPTVEVAPLFKQGNEALAAHHPDKALAAFKAARQAPATLKEVRLQAYAEYGMGRAEMALDHPAEAIRHLTTARGIYRGLHDAMERTLVLALASACEAGSDLAGARTWLGQAIALARAAKQNASVAGLLERRGQIEQTLGLTQESLADFGQAANLYREAGDLAAVAKLWTSLGRSYRQLGDAPAAISAFEQAVHLAQDRSDPGTAGLLQLEEGETYMALRDYAAAAAHVKAAQDALSGRGGVPESRLLLAQGRLNELTGDVAAAQQAYRQAASLVNDAEHPAQESLSLQAEGQLMAQEQDLKNGLIVLHQALEQSEGDGRRQVQLLLPISDIEAVGGDVKEAQKDAVTAQKLATGLHLPVALEVATGQVASLQEREGLAAEAMATYQQAAAMAVRYNDAESLWQWQWGIGRTLEAAGNFTDALRAYRQAIETEEKLPGLHPAPATYGSYLHERSGPYRSAIHLLLRQNDPTANQEAFQLAERANRDHFLQLLAGVPIAAQFPDAQGASVREEHLRFRLQALMLELQDSATESTARRIAATLQRLQAEETELLGSLSRTNPRYYQLLNGTIPTAQDVAAQTPAGTLFLEFFQLPNALAVWAIDGQGVTTVHVPVPRKELADRIHALSDAVAGGGPWKAAAADLSTLLFGDLQEPLDRANHLVLVAPGAMSYVPFEVLMPSKTLSYAPSARTWLSLPTGATQGPHQRVESETRETFMGAMHDGGRVDVAVPWHLSAETPMYSGLLLNNNTSLSLVDWLGLRGRPTLVTLTGSDLPWLTGRLGDQAMATSETIMAGGSGLMMAAWQSSGPNRQPLLAALDRHLDEGMAPSAALHQAVVDVSQSQPDPRAWAWLRCFAR